MSKNKSTIKNKTIAKYLAGEANAHEIEKVEAWIKESKGNARHFAKLRSLWERTGKEDSQSATVDVDAAWAKVDGRTSSNKSPQGAKVITLWPYLLRVAAVLIFSMLIYFIYNKVDFFSEDTFVSGNETRSETLPDESLVSMNSNSKLSVAKEFSKETRKVTLEGEAFFKVKPNPELPFVIKVQGGFIKVLGTSFFVKAYDSLDVVEIGVEEGRVSVAMFGVEKILTKGDRISISKSSGDIIESDYEPNELFWKSKALIFENESLQKVFDDLRGAYNVSIEVDNSAINSCHLSGKFDQKTVERIFEIIGANFNLSVSQQGRSFKISGKGCD